jgi:tetratricopeptide (TPR) repeat protein
VQQPSAADQVIDQMVAAAPESGSARLAAARYYAQWHNWTSADEHVRYAAEKLKSSGADVSLLSADAALALGERDRARSVLEDGLKHYPDDLHLRQRLARFELVSGHKERATEVAAPIPVEAPQTVGDLLAQAALMIELDQPDKADVMIRRIEAAREPLAAAAAGCLRGQLLVRQKAWGDARVVLEKARAAAQLDPDLSRRVNMLLAECYSRQGNTDQVLIAYQHVLKLATTNSAADPTLIAARRGVASALYALGKTDDAITLYRMLAADVPDVRPDLARALLTRNRRQPIIQRDWTEFDQILKAMSPQERATPTVGQIEIEALILQDELDDARKLVEAARDRDPKLVGPWLMLIGFAAREKSPDAVPKVLAEAERQTGWHVEWELARVNQALRLAAGGGVPTEQTVARLKQIETTLTRCPDADKGRLLAALASATQSTGDRINARRLWRQAIDAAADKQDLRFVLFELAVRDGDMTEAGKLRDDIGTAEGAGGPIGSYCEAVCWAVEARKGDLAARAAARAALARAAEMRPSWSRVHLLDGELCEQEGRQDKALEKYQEAMDRGDDRLIVLRRVLQLLYEQHRYAEAHALLKRVPEPALARTDLRRVAAELFVVSPDETAGHDAAKARALQLARQAVAADSKDYRGLLWLGQLADRAGEPAEAERALRRAVEVADTRPETWISLALFLSRTDPKKSEAELEKAKLKVPKGKLPLVLAPGYEILGRMGPAEEQYRAALAAQPTDPTALQSLAAFYARTGQSAKAVPVFRQLIDKQTQAAPTTVAWARRALAISLPVLGDHRQFNEAITLIDANAAAGPPTAEDRLAKALLMAHQPSHRKEAIEVFESLSVRKDALPPDAEFMLAQLYEADGDWRKARAHLQALVNEHDKNPVYVVGLIRALLRHDAAGDARPLVERLAALHPDAYETAELKARLLKIDGRMGEAAAVMRAYAAAGKGDRLLAAADVLQDLGLPAEAELLYREFATSAGRPDASLPLAVFYGRVSRAGDGLAICEPAWATCPPMTVARACVSIVRAGPATEGQRRQVEKWLQAAIAKNPQMLGLRVLIADLYDYDGRHDEAVVQYRRILDEAPGNVIALNNLAFLLALKSGPSDEALSYINRAIDAAGPMPQFLDTRAVVYLKSQQADLAIRDLQQALAETPMANAYYHLATAQMAVKNRSAAAESLRKATAAKLKPTDLHLLEQDNYRNLMDDLRLD